MNANRLLSFAIVSLLAFLSFSPVLYPAESKTVEQMVKERQVQLDSLTALQKQFSDNQAAFSKLPAVVEYNRKQKELNDQAEKIQTKVRELEGKIVNAIAKEGPKK